MWSSAVSLLLFSLASGASDQQLTTSEENAWKAISPRVAQIMSAGTAGGVCALLNEDGYFVAYRDAVGATGSFVFVRMGSGETAQLNVVAVDEMTQLALLKADGWKPMRRDQNVANPFATRQDKALQSGMPLIAVLPSGPIRAELTQTDKFGVMSASKRGVTLNEIRFEKPGTNLGGGLIYSLDGRLVGILGATLQVAPSPAAANKPTGVGGNLKGVGGDGRGNTFGSAGGVSTFGPGQMTVAYSISGDILGRVIEGFLSPSHKVIHPAIGIFASDAPNNAGALITSITKDSPADKAGIRPGDIVVRLGDSGVIQAVDIIKFMNHQEVGATVTIIAKRGEEILTFSVKIGSSG